MTAVSLQTTAALHEEKGLSEYYRRRNLYLAQTVLDLEAENASLKSELAGVTSQITEALIPASSENSEE